VLILNINSLAVQLKLDLDLRVGGVFSSIHDRLYTRHFRKEGVNAVCGEQVQVLPCPGAVAQPAEQKKRIPLRTIRGNKSAGEGSSLGHFEDFSIPPALSFKEIIELDESLAKPQL